ncbi:Mur ligase family protein [Poriferisphaera sp. WC338]|uniref:Mur ligase family protein n=1 Tax=Poriferisphaera sp. WC338 TaxID=3425129 RepID=UPI003D8183A8
MTAISKQLSDIITDLNLTLAQGSLDITITDITDDSRTVTPNCLFIARSWQHHGDSIIGSPTGTARQYIKQAIDCGATAIIDIAEADIPTYDATLDSPAYSQDQIPDHITILRTKPGIHIDQAFAGRIADNFYDHPSSKLKLLGITGTNGKTTTAFITQHLLQSFDLKVGLIGTVQTDDGNIITETDLTTPGAIDIRKFLNRMLSNNCTAAVMEVSSHALHQQRTEGLHFDAAIFTNLTGDHLDFHPDMNAYAAAKARLFESLGESAWAILNADDPAARRMAQTCSAHIIWTGSDPDFSVAGHTHQLVSHAKVTALSTTGVTARYTGPWGSFATQLPLIGKYNALNALQAVAAVNTLLLPKNLKTKTARKALQQTPQVPGRLEQVIINPPEADIAAIEMMQSQFTLDPITGQPDEPLNIPPAAHLLPTVFVDYSHTDDSLENALLALRPLAEARIITVFGCGGDRDKSKRPRMFAVANEYSDIVIVTADNPRSEPIDQIINDVITPTPGSKSQTNLASDTILIEPDRAKAIERAVLLADANDIVLIAGKGHETYQILRPEDVTDLDLIHNATPAPNGTIKIHFDDREHAAEALKHWGTRFDDNHESH